MVQVCIRCRTLMTQDSRGSASGFSFAFSLTGLLHEAKCE
jgi:hypothetical protein